MVTWTTANGRRLLHGWCKQPLLRINPFQNVFLIHTHSFMCLFWFIPKQEGAVWGWLRFHQQVNLAISEFTKSRLSINHVSNSINHFSRFAVSVRDYMYKRQTTVVCHKLGKVLIFIPCAAITRRKPSLPLTISFWKFGSVSGQAKRNSKKRLDAFSECAFLDSLHAGPLIRICGAWVNAEQVNGHSSGIPFLGILHAKAISPNKWTSMNCKFCVWLTI